MSDDLMSELRHYASDRNGPYQVAAEARPVMHDAADRIEELEAKLAKAVWALEKLDVGEGWAAQIARTTLAELKGQEDEGH